MPGRSTICIAQARSTGARVADAGRPRTAYAGEADPYKRNGDEGNPQSCADDEPSLTWHASCVGCGGDRQADGLDGSHQVVCRRSGASWVRARLEHAGTLDPMATGVLLIGIGRAKPRFAPDTWR